MCYLLTKAVDFFSTMHSKILEFASVKTLKWNILNTFNVQLLKNSLVLSLLSSFYFLICGVQPLEILKLSWGLKNQDMGGFVPQMQQDMIMPIITEWYEIGILIKTTGRSL